MPLNPFFLQGSKLEQNLVQDLINEQLKMYGIDVYYMPRQFIKKNSIIKEVVKSEFNNAYPLEAYLETYDGYGGQGTILSKFGIEEVDDITLIISRDRYETYIKPLIENLEDAELGDRPKEGDLIYFPLGDRLFEIKYVEHEKPFYQLNKNYVYELRCELFRYQDEIIDTTIEDIDDNTKDIGYIQTLQMFTGAGVTATAYISNVVKDGVRRFILSSGGDGYTSPPKVRISMPQDILGFGTEFAGAPAAGIASMFGPQTFQSVKSIEITNSGYGYTTSSPPQVIFLEGGGQGASATVEIGRGVLQEIRLIQGGGGYLNPPIVTISEPVGTPTGITTSQAEAVARINGAGIVTSVAFTNAGLGYTRTPTVTFSTPDLMVPGIGTFRYNESITGQQSGATGIVKSWNVVTGILELSNVIGQFNSGEGIVGADSEASYTLRIGYTDNLADAGDSNNKYGKYEDNYDIQVEADGILDFTEENPFGRV